MTKNKTKLLIQDEFTNAKKRDGTPMSRQQIHMLRKRKLGFCWTCSKKALKGKYFCLHHMQQHNVRMREAMRRKIKATKRNLSAESYWHSSRVNVEILANLRD